MQAIAHSYLRDPARVTVGSLELAANQNVTQHVEVLEPFQKEPVVTVAVRNIRSYRLFMLGRVGTQSMIESPTPLRLLQALAVAGGLNEFASKKIVVLRDTSEGQKRIEIDYGDILKGKSPEQNIMLLSGDIVVAE